MSRRGNTTPRILVRLCYKIEPRLRVSRLNIAGYPFLAPPREEFPSFIRNESNESDARYIRPQALERLFPVLAREYMHQTFQHMGSATEVLADVAVGETYSSGQNLFESVMR